MFNEKIFTWKFKTDGYPDEGKPVHILVEHDVVHKLDEDVPFLRNASLTVDTSVSPPVKVWKLLDIDTDFEEEILQQYYTVVAWRYI